MKISTFVMFVSFLFSRTTVNGQNSQIEVLSGGFGIGNQIFVKPKLDGLVGSDGIFKHQIPLISLPNDLGMSYQLTLSYSSEYTKGQMSGLVGFGWVLNTGEIERQVNGRVDEQHNSMFQMDNNETSKPRLRVSELLFGQVTSEKSGIAHGDLKGDNWDLYSVNSVTGSMELLPVSPAGNQSFYFVGAFAKPNFARRFI
jgi:hypothetical protein